MGEQIKSTLLLTLWQQVYSYFSFHLPAIRLFISTWKKSYEDVYHSALHVSATTRNMKITIKRFTSYHLLLSSNSTFMTKSLNLGTIQIWRDELMNTAII